MFGIKIVPKHTKANRHDCMINEIDHLTSARIINWVMMYPKTTPKGDPTCNNDIITVFLVLGPY
jgi:hypothetical protein